MTRQIQSLLTRADEESLSLALRHTFPPLLVVDGNRWEAPEPPTRNTIPECTESIVMLWNTALAPTLPSKRRPDGRYDGPIVGPVIQVVRSRLEGNTLRSGRFAASTDEPLLERFVEELWRLIRRWGVTKVRSINPSTGATINPRVPGYLIGPDAAAWWSIADARLLRDRSTENYFAPAD